MTTTLGEGVLTFRYSTQTFAMSPIFRKLSHIGSRNLANSYSSTRAIEGIQNGRSISNRFRDIRGQSSTFDLDYLRNG
jgi:hypothetical protein